MAITMTLHQNLFVTAASLVLFSTLAACSADSNNAGYDPTASTTQKVHQACVYERKTSLSCVGSDGSPGEWESACDEDSDCRDVSGDSDIFGDCSSTTVVRNTHVVSGTCSEARSKTASPTPPPASSSSSSSSSSSGTPTIAPKPTPTPEPEEEPSAKCESLVTRICSRLIGCGMDVTTTECESALSDTLECSSSTGVNSNYPSCMADLNSISCSALSEDLPTSCNGVLK